MSLASHIILPLLLQSTLSANAPSSWKFDCIEKAFRSPVKPSFHILGKIYYIYYQNPIKDPVYYPEYSASLVNKIKKQTTYVFFLTGSYDIRIFFVFNDRGKLIDRFANTPSTPCTR